MNTADFRVFFMRQRCPAVFYVTRAKETICDKPPAIDKNNVRAIEQKPESCA